MSHELQGLIDRIQQEAIGEAQEEKAQLIEQAKAQAATLIKEAEAEAELLLKNAEQEAEKFAVRSHKRMEQAGRNLLIQVGIGLEQVLQDLVEQATAEALDTDTLHTALLHLVEQYAQTQGQDSRIEFLLSAEDQEAVTRFFESRLSAALRAGVTVNIHPEIQKGFQVSFKEEKAYHDFTHTAIATALTNYLRPRLADIVQQAATRQEEA